MFSKVLFMLSCILLVVNILPASCFGGVHKMTGVELQQAKVILDSSLAKLKTEDGVHYKVVELMSATIQIVSGTVYNFVAKIQSGSAPIEQCHISIWSRPWVANSNQVTMNCI